MSEDQVQQAPEENPAAPVVAEPQTKPFWKSKTFWCLLIATVLVIFDFGVDDMTSKMEEIATLASLLGAFLGRMDAQGPMSVGSLTFSKRG